MWHAVEAKSERPVSFTKERWPILIHGTPKSGALFFTVVLTAGFIKQGKQVVFLCSQGEAIRALQKELGLDKPAGTFTAVTSSAASALENMHLVTLFKQRHTNLLESLRALKDWSQRIVVVNNADVVLTPELWAVVKFHRQLIVSGDFEKIKFDVGENTFPTVILFSPSPGHWHRQRQSLPSYIGDVHQAKKQFQVILRETADGTS